MEYEGIGQNFQQLTKYDRDSMPRRGRIAGQSSQKRNRVPLREFAPPPPLTTGGLPLWDAIQRRRSIRSYSKKPLALAHLVQLLWATQGITSPSQGYRSAPSAGALYPSETYLVVNQIEGLEAGLYHYEPANAALRLLGKGNLGSQLARAALGQPMMEEAGVVFAWTAVIARNARKYAERAYRYIYLDTGHIAQNLYLAATALGLGCCAAAAFFDDEINNLLDVDGQEETVIYLASVGNPR